MARPRLYATPEEAAEANRRKTRERKRERVNQTKPNAIYEGLLQCCKDWVDAGSRNRRTCPQHKTWRLFINTDSERYRSPERHTNADYMSHDKQIVADLWDEWRDASGKLRSGGFSVKVNPDSYWPKQDDDPVAARLFTRRAKRQGLDDTVLKEWKVLADED